MPGIRFAGSGVRVAGITGAFSRALICAIFLCGLPLPALLAQGSIDNTAQPPPATNNSQDNTQQTLPNAQRLPGYSETTPMTGATPTSVAGQGTENLRAWRGLRVSAIRFDGVPQERLNPLPGQLDLQPGQPLDPTRLRSSLRRLYATGLYQTIDVEGTRVGDQVNIVFTGKPQLFIGRVTVTGVSDNRFSGLLEGATKLSPGTAFDEEKLKRSDQLVEQTLEENGYYDAGIKSTTLTDKDAQININYDVTTGKQARIGEVTIEGEPGLAVDKARKKAKLKRKSRVNRDTVNTAIGKLRAIYEKQQRLEASVTLDSKKYNPPPNTLDYTFKVNQGPRVVILVDGVKMSKAKIKNLVPVFQEGTVDEDLLNEGDRRIRDIYQRDGYFSVRVEHARQVGPSETTITYNVTLGPVYDVDSVSVAGNKYFETALIEPRLNVKPASIFVHRGLYSAALVASDVSTITAIYQGNGFSNVKVVPETKESNLDKHGKPSKISHVSVTYQITEGVQQRFGTYTLAGEQKIPLKELLPLLNTQSGQPYSSMNLTGDRDAVLTYYLSHGFDQATANLEQAPDPKDPNLINVTMRITEGEQIFVNQVLISGLHYTRHSTVDNYVHVHPGDVLNQTALIDTQRQLYDLTLFNAVNTAVQNPSGEELKKNVLVQFTEAKRWDVSYGFGLEVQTGEPTTCNIALRIQEGLSNSCANNASGQFGAGGLVEVNISRINLRGSDNSLTLRTAYGTLEQRAVLTYADPRFFGHRNFDFSLSGGYTNARDITTYAASRLEGTARMTERVSRPTTLIYSFTFRRVKVDPNSLQIDPSEIPLDSQSATVGGPGITYIRDTRRPTPLDAGAGTYNTVSEFFSNSGFGAESNFNRIDATNSSYYVFGARRYVFARSTRLGFLRSYGSSSQEFIPLPERLYAGGAQSHRGFGINDAGPRDSETGFPIGGAAVAVNSFELRLPDPTLPVFGDSLGFVLFHDMGNAFVKGSDIWPSFLRFRQPDRGGCRDISMTDQAQPNAEHNSIGLNGLCSYNYFSHALGIGARYKTPIGPIRLDTSYNLNPPLYPQPENYNSQGITTPRYSQAPHFNFFFSIGQAF